MLIITSTLFLVSDTLFDQTLQIRILHTSCNTLLIVYLLIDWKERLD